MAEYAAAGGAPRSIVLVAPAGAGKSRLLNRLGTLVGLGGMMLVDGIEGMDEPALRRLVVAPPGFVVIAARPDAAARLAGLGGAPIMVALGPLTLAEAGTVARALCADLGVPAERVGADALAEMLEASGGWLGPLGALVAEYLAPRAQAEEIAPPPQAEEIAPSPLVVAAPAAVMAAPAAVMAAPAAVMAAPAGRRDWGAARSLAVASVPLVLVLVAGGLAWGVNPGLVQVHVAPVALGRVQEAKVSAPRSFQPGRGLGPFGPDSRGLGPFGPEYRGLGPFGPEYRGLGPFGPSGGPGGKAPWPALPLSAPAHVQVVYLRGDAGAARAAGLLAHALHDQRIAVDPPVGQDAVEAPGIRYYFVEDGAAAAAVRQVVGGDTPVVLADAAQDHAPGAIEVVVAPARADTRAGLVN